MTSERRSRTTFNARTISRISQRGAVSWRSQRYEGLDTIGERLARLSRETGAFLDRAAAWHRMWLREPMVTGVWAEAGAAYGAKWDALFRAALGSLADDPDAMAMLRATMHPTFYEAVRSGSRSTIETADLIAAALTPWFEIRTRAARRRPSRWTTSPPDLR